MYCSCWLKMATMWIFVHTFQLSVYSKDLLWKLKIGSFDLFFSFSLTFFPQQPFPILFPRNGLTIYFCTCMYIQQFHVLFDLAMDPYVKIICEGEKVQSIVVNNEKNPKFGTKATFYRKKVDQPIIVEVCSAYQISMLLKELILRIYFLFFRNDVHKNNSNCTCF